MCSICSGVISVSFERQPSGDIKTIAYPCQPNIASASLDINTLKVASGNSLPSTANSGKSLCIIVQCLLLVTSTMDSILTCINSKLEEVWAIVNV